MAWTWWMELPFARPLLFIISRRTLALQAYSAWPVTRVCVDERRCVQHVLLSYPNPSTWSREREGTCTSSFAQLARASSPWACDRPWQMQIYATVTLSVPWVSSLTLPTGNEYSLPLHSTANMPDWQDQQPPADRGPTATPTPSPRVRKTSASSWFVSFRGRPTDRRRGSGFPVKSCLISIHGRRRACHLGSVCALLSFLVPVCQISKFACVPMELAGRAYVVRSTGL